MSLRLAILALVLLVSGCAGVKKAPAPATAATAPAPDLVARDLEKYRLMFKRGIYGEVLADINQKIAALPTDKRANPDPRLLFVRGMAYYHLSWFREAKADLLVAQKADIHRLVSKSFVQRILQKIDNLTPLLPPNMREIRDGERVIFRMHSFATEGDAATVAQMLPDAYRINRQIFGQDVEAIPIFVFDNYDRFSAFYRKYNGAAPSSWEWAVTTGTLVQISLRNKKNVAIARYNRPFFYGAIVHEVNHAMINRLMGNAKFPPWFKEGLAQVVEVQVKPDFDADKQRRIAHLFQDDKKGLLPIEKLRKNKFFFDQVELGVTLRKSGKRAGAPDPYAQSYGLMKSLLSDFSTAQLQSFLARVRKSDDFDGSFAAEFGMTTAQFYEKWKAKTTRELTAR